MVQEIYHLYWIDNGASLFSFWTSEIADMTGKIGMGPPPLESG